MPYTVIISTHEHTPRSSKEISEFAEEITHQIHQEKVQAGMKMELQFLHVRTLALPVHNSQEHVFLQNDKGREREQELKYQKSYKTELP